MFISLYVQKHNDNIITITMADISATLQYLS